MTFARKLRDIRYALFYRLLVSKGFKLTTLGNPSLKCAWTLSPLGLNKASVVYSAGVGRDITFEHALVENYGCNVILLDPSPTGRETMAVSSNQIPQFTFFPLALAGHDGELALSPPADPEEGSWRSDIRDASGLKVAAISLQSLMQKNAHTIIDLLKIDIEGSEYEVIDDILSKEIPVKQLCVEFHHGNSSLLGTRRSLTIRTIVRLILRGYKLIHVWANDHTFLKV